ncbi:hypothetical protein WICPIJ_004517 [Wickerhamomyces pijperi]|uniref:Uncharacterized protein n=1 Tax=Wickerhamomyces pijperi TaxID=599730 RepID=A0A9P8Q5D1_WICPI|nr:hypothetical protein WICPIJ_004517 [Wickerhamomyces pijperi]
MKEAPINPPMERGRTSDTQSLRVTGGFGSGRYGRVRDCFDVFRVCVLDLSQCDFQVFQIVNDVSGSKEGVTHDQRIVTTVHDGQDTLCGGGR